MKRFNDFLNESGVDGIDFCVVCIIGHGRINGQTKQEEIVGIDGKGVPKELLEEIIIEAKNCPIMHGKPKIFLVQACRGMVDNETLRKEQKRQRRSGEEDSGIESCGIASDGNPEEVAQNSWHMTFQSTVRGYTSYRHKEMGSFFLQIFCHTMEQIGHLSSFSEVLRKSSSMGETTYFLYAIGKVKFLAKNSVLTKPQHFHEFFTEIFFDNFLRKSKLNFWTKNEDFEQCANKS